MKSWKEWERKRNFRTVPKKSVLVKGVITLWITPFFFLCAFPSPATHPHPNKLPNCILQCQHFYFSLYLIIFHLFLFTYFMIQFHSLWDFPSSLILPPHWLSLLQYCSPSRTNSSFSSSFCLPPSLSPFFFYIITIQEAMYWADLLTNQLLITLEVYSPSESQKTYFHSVFQSSLKFTAKLGGWCRNIP